MNLRAQLLNLLRAIGIRRSRRCNACGLLHCDGTRCAQIIAEGQRIRAMMHQADGTATQQALLAPWERYIDELAQQGKL